MDYINEYLKVSMAPVANPEAVVTVNGARFTILTSRIIRMEYNPFNKFEDRATLAFWYRNQPVPEYKVIKNDTSIEIITEYLHLKYKFNKFGFTASSLSVKLLNSNKIWHYLDRAMGNLKGTARTLDATNGKIPLEDGLISRDGWALIDDSTGVVFDENCWVHRRFKSEETFHEDEYKDLYFFGYGNDYKECISDFIKLSGKTPMFPRWALGNWWSRYWSYTQDELKGLMEKFEAYDIPLSVCIVDMDWHIVKNPYSSGWTGYTWNKELFPDPKGFMTWLHEKNLKTGLNLHPALGVHPHEEQYEEMAKAMGIAPESKEPVDFDITDPKFTKNYFEILHHPHEKSGVDFWWMDWQQGFKTRLHGLDPLPWLNHLHYYDLQRDGEKRGFVFSRYGGPGSQRYPIGFSGDTYTTWESLKFQPYFTATASNIAYGWWSHDIGGHMGGYESPELYARWVQYGVFSPILRLHSTNILYNDRQPWTKGEDILRISKKAMKLRHALIPYIYTMMWRNHDENLPMILPMYYEHPEKDEAYTSPSQYYFGSELIAAPFVNPIDKDLNLSRQTVWLPNNHWFNFFTGEYYEGNKTYGIYGDLEDIPVFAKAGAIIPTAVPATWNETENPSELDVYVFPGESGSFNLYEDDGTSTTYSKGDHCITALSTEWGNNTMSFVVSSVKGHLSNIPLTRKFNFIFRGITSDCSIKVIVDGREADASVEYESSTESLLVKGVMLNVQNKLQIILSTDNDNLMSKQDRSIDNLKKLLWNMNYEGFTKNWIEHMLVNERRPLSILNAAIVPLTSTQLRAIIETVKGQELSTLAD